MIPALNFSFRQRIKLGVTNTVFGFSGTLFNFIFSILVVRLFSDQFWGKFAETLLIVSLLSMVTGWGSKDFFLREFSRTNKVAQIWQTSLLSRLFIFAGVIPFIFLFNAIAINPLLFALWIFSNFLIRSFDASIVFERKFKEAIGIELLGFLIICASLFLFSKVMTIQVLVLLFIFSTALKSVGYYILFHRTLFSTFVGTISKNQLLLCLPYFLPPFIGFLQAKSDTFAIALTLSEKELGIYYLLINLLSHCHAVAILAIAPFLKNIYRINSISFQKIQRNFILIGLAWSIVYIAGIYSVLTFLFGFYLSGSIYCIAWLALPPYFMYYLLMQDFLRQDKPYVIVFINLAAAILNFCISLLLVRQYGFAGGLVSCALMQWILLVGFYSAHKWKKSSPSMV